MLKWEAPFVDDVGVQPEAKKWPEDGKMRHIAFIYDPDRYWVEIGKALSLLWWTSHGSLTWREQSQLADKIATLLVQS